MKLTKEMIDKIKSEDPKGLAADIDAHLRKRAFKIFLKAYVNAADAQLHELDTWKDVVTKGNIVLLPFPAPEGFEECLQHEYDVALERCKDCVGLELDICESYKDISQMIRYALMDMIRLAGDRLKGEELLERLGLNL